MGTLLLCLPSLRYGGSWVILGSGSMQNSAGDKKIYYIIVSLLQVVCSSQLKP